MLRRWRSSRSRYTQRFRCHPRGMPSQPGSPAQAWSLVLANRTACSGAAGSLAQTGTATAICARHGRPGKELPLIPVRGSSYAVGTTCRTVAPGWCRPSRPFTGCTPGPGQSLPDSCSGAAAVRCDDDAGAAGEQLFDPGRPPVELGQPHLRCDRLHLRAALGPAGRAVKLAGPVLAAVAELARVILIVAGVIVGVGAAGPVGLLTWRWRRSRGPRQPPLHGAASPLHGEARAAQPLPAAAAVERPTRSPPAPARRVPDRHRRRHRAGTTGRTRRRSNREPAP